jgi:P27 family predicted phage terminase small subunit
MPTNNIKPPTILKGESLKEWQRITQELTDLGRLNNADRAIMVQHCQTWQINREAYQRVLSDGQTMEYSNGVMGPSPWYKNWGETTKMLRGTLADLGLTPNARGFDLTADEPEELEV